MRGSTVMPARREIKNTAAAAARKNADVNAALKNGLAARVNNAAADGAQYNAAPAIKIGTSRAAMPRNDSAVLEKPM